VVLLRKRLRLLVVEKRDKGKRKKKKKKNRERESVVLNGSYKRIRVCVLCFYTNAVL
jgi:hypothetical protein